MFGSLPPAQRLELSGRFFTVFGARYARPAPSATRATGTRQQRVAFNLGSPTPARKEVAKGEITRRREAVLERAGGLHALSGPKAGDRQHEFAREVLERLQVTAALYESAAKAMDNFHEVQDDLIAVASVWRAATDYLQEAWLEDILVTDDDKDDGIYGLSFISYR